MLSGFDHGVREAEGKMFYQKMWRSEGESMSVHADRFTGRVDDYERYRSRYPREVLELLRERCGLRVSDVVADIGAGTGMLAEVFLENGNTVLAIEPNAEMRAACERVLGAHARLRVVNAFAEATGLEDACVDIIAVGRAFHWFDRERAVQEFRRILKPGGWVVLITNRRTPGETEQSREYEEILLKHGTDYADIRQGYRNYESLRLFGEGESVEVKLPGEQRLRLEEFLGQTQSLSISPMPGHAQYEAMQGALRAFFAKWSEDGVLRLETMCSVLGWRTPG